MAMGDDADGAMRRRAERSLVNFILAVAFELPWLECRFGFCVLYRYTRTWWFGPRFGQRVYFWCDDLYGCTFFPF